MSKKVVKCENCFAYNNQGKNHQCGGLMKMLVKNYKQKNKNKVK